MQKIYFDNTMFFRENGKAHNKVEAFGYCVSFKDTYCKSMKIEKIVISTNPSIPAYSGERHNKNTGKRIHTANIINTYFFTIKKSPVICCLRSICASLDIYDR